MKTILLFILFLSLFSASIYGQNERHDDGLPQKPKKPTSTNPTEQPSTQGREVHVPLLPQYDPAMQKPNYSLAKVDFKSPSKTSFVDKPYAKFIVPTVLISYGVTARFYKPLRDLDYSTDHELGEHYGKGTWVDDYLQFAPAVGVYGLDLVGIPAKHNFRDRTLIMATSYLVMGVTVETMKRTINVPRPNDRGNSSFPSGHAATAFVGAHILMKEYKDVSPWIGVAGYTAATGVGAMRVINHKHWISDIAIGAGIGILSAEVGYMMLPVWHNVFGIKDRNSSLAIVPTVTSDAQGRMGYGLGMSYQF